MAPQSDIVVFGGTGFVGASLARWFARPTGPSAPRRVSVIAHERRPDPAVLPASADVVTGSMETRETVAACLDACGAMEQTLVINAAGEKNVRLCETDPDRAHHVNAGCAATLAAEVAARGLAFVQISTDLVFDCLTGGYKPTDPAHPRTVYGQSKLAGERAVRQAHPDALILRSAGIYGDHSPLLAWLKTELTAGKTVECFTDVCNSPTYAPNLAEIIEAAHRTAIVGQTLHACGPQPVSRHTLFCQAVQHLGWSDLPGRLQPVVGGAERDARLLQPDASLDVEQTHAMLPDVTLDGPETGFQRLAKMTSLQDGAAAAVASPSLTA